MRRDELGVKKAGPKQQAGSNKTLSTVLAVSANKDCRPVELCQGKAFKVLFRVSCGCFLEQLDGDILAQGHAEHVVGDAPVDARHVAAFADVGGQLIQLSKDGQIV